ncbi:MAG TPA: hypothetical protein DD670_08720 [Planctomycetaceae bacterium]|nr:hypothetical protein [Planctomycetaceae bacterium]
MGIIHAVCEGASDFRDIRGRMEAHAVWARRLRKVCRKPNAVGNQRLRGKKTAKPPFNPRPSLADLARREDRLQSLRPSRPT